MRSPPNRTEPRQGFTSPEIVFSKVDFPVPLPPSRATILPSPTASETPCRIWTLPYPASTPSSSSNPPSLPCQPWPGKPCANPLEHIPSGLDEYVGRKPHAAIGDDDSCRVTHNSNHFPVGEPVAGRR